jgi:salicylate hydroxylase
MRAQIYEASRFAQETGAAIHLPPNVVGLLNRIGFDRSKLGANDTEWVCKLVCSNVGED